ncbi:cell division control protein (mcm family) [Picrophilus oshimae DSM 9789]|uniref:DNA helicase n=2 Tax=Picrophilus oshimae TaxID=46632 RepID=Q6KZQ0_PICTO|nr:cell division control protein (mcm family) [Picrophilus oshimae DSM 9789]
MLMIEQAEIDLIKKRWADFFDRYDYESDINRLRERYPDERSLYISYKDLSSFDIDFADNIRKDPVTYLSAGEDYLKTYIGRTREKISRLNIRLKDIPERNFKYEIRNVRSTNVDTFISVTGIIRKNTEVLPRLDIAVFRCPNCGSIISETEYYRKMNEPAKCDSCNYHGKFILEIDQSTFIDTQKLEIQENPDTLDGTSQPQRMTVIMEDDITGRIFPGDRVTIYGILKADQKFIGSIKLTEFNIFLYANNFKKETKDFEDIRITDEDEENIKKLSSCPDIIDRLSRSIAPSIYGLEVIKKALVLQLFGGVRKVLKDGTTIRGDIHILMVGDPGTAKSQLLRYMTSLAPRSVFAFGKGSSAAGLTAAAVRDDFGEGRWTLEAGALVLADNGFAAIDELDKMDQRDTASMHEAMEQQSVTISKAGIMATLKSRCSILAAANPKFGRYDVTRTIAEQIDFPPPLLSRFDIIFKLVDTPNKDNDSRLAEHILMTHRIGEIYRSIENTNINIDIPDEEKYIPEIDKDLIRKYISYAKNRIFPRLSDEAIRILREEYVNTRSSGVDSIPITARQLESTIRLAEAAARARLSSIVTEADALLAKSIVDYYLKDVSAINGKVDIDILNTGMSSRQRNEAELIMDVIKELKNENKRPPEIDDVIEYLASRGISRKDAENSIQKLKIGGFLYEPSSNRIDVIK